MIYGRTCAEVTKDKKRHWFWVYTAEGNVLIGEITDPSKSQSTWEEPYPLLG